MPPGRMVRRLAMIPTSLATLLLAADFGQATSAHAQSLARSSPASALCRPFQEFGGTPAVRNVTPRIRIGDVIEYVSYGEMIDSISYQDTGGSDAKIDGRNKVKVMANGYIFLPRIGMLKIVGLTIPEAQQKMTQAMAAYYRRPILSIYGLEQSTIRVKITGQVRSPGSYQLGSQLSDDKEDMALRQRPNTLEELIVRAGGLLNTADFQAVEIHTREGKCFSINLDINQAGRSRDGQLALDDGDSVVVRYAPQIDVNSPQYLLMAKSDLATEKQRVYVLGDVAKPGLVETSWLATPLQVIALAGGPLQNASRSAYMAQHEGESKSYRIEKLSIDVRSSEVRSGFQGQITDGTVIFVGKSTLGKVQEALQGFLAPAALGVGLSGAFR